MKKIIIPLFLLSFLLSPLLVGAQEEPRPEPSSVATFEDLIVIIERGTSWLLWAVIVIAMLMIVYAGLKWMTAGGVEDKMSEARRLLTYALTGVGIALLARGFVYIIKKLVGAA